MKFINHSTSLRQYIGHYLNFQSIKKKKLTISSTPAGTTIGLKDRECGHIGVTMIAGTEG